MRQDDSNIERLRALTYSDDTGEISIPNVNSAIWERIFDRLPDGVILVDAIDGKILLANAAANKIFGYQWPLDDGSVVVEDLLPKDLRENHKALRQEYADNPQPISLLARDGFPVLGLRRDGSTIAVDVELNFMVITGRRILMAAIRPTR